VLFHGQSTLRGTIGSQFTVNYIGRHGPILTMPMPIHHIHQLPICIIAHISTILGSYPTTDVGSLLSLSTATRKEWIAADLIFLAMRNELKTRCRFNGHDITTPSSSKKTRRRTSMSPQRKSKRLKISGPELLKATIVALQRNAERAHDATCGIAQNKNQRSKVTIHSFRTLLQKWSPLDANHLHSRGSTLLMEITKLSIKRASPAQVFKMAKELLNKWDVDPSKAHPTSRLSPLMISAARGYTKVVALLINSGRCNVGAQGKGTFFSSVGAVGGRRIRHTGTHTALEWCCEMKQMERNAGASLLEIRDLEECERLLREVAREGGG
jgi:hypothetical protein